MAILDFIFGLLILIANLHSLLFMCERIYSIVTKKRVKGVFILVGPRGNGKSSTANFLLGNKGDYQVAERIDNGTWKIRYKTVNGLTVADCPGFGYDYVPVTGTIIADQERKELGTRALLRSFQAEKDFFVNKTIDSIVFCIRFVEETPRDFYRAAEDFLQIFGNLGVESLFFLVIQEGTRNPPEDLQKILHAHPVYRMLRNRIRRDIPFCLWDNKEPFSDQFDNFIKCTKEVKKFNFTHERIEIMQLVEDRLARNNQQ